MNNKEAVDNHLKVLLEDMRASGNTWTAEALELAIISLEKESFTSMRDRNFIIQLHNEIRIVETNISHKRTFKGVTDKERGYHKCLIDIWRNIRDYMHIEGNKERFYGIRKGN